METLQLASIFKSLSEPVRLRILSLLMESEEICVCELVDTLELPQSVVSRHLAYLRNNNLVTAKREGAWMYYQLNRSAEIDLSLLFQFINGCVVNSPEMQNDRHKLNNNCSSC